MWWLIVAVGIAISYWLHWRYQNRHFVDLSNRLPGPKPFPLIGNALYFMCQPEEMTNMIKKLIDSYGDVLRFWLGADLNVIVTNPDDLKILLTSPKTNQKGPQYKYMADILGGGILSGSGHSWRRHRKMASPNYRKNAVESYGDIFHEEIAYLLEKYRRIPKSQEHSIYSDIVHTTSYTVCQTLMGLSREQVLRLPYIENIINLTPEIYAVTFERMTKWWYQIDPIFKMTTASTKIKRFKSMTREFSKAIVRSRIDFLKKLKESEKNALLYSEDDSVQNTKLNVIDTFILSQDLDYDELLNETFTVFTSSQEASAKIASFLLLMMAYHPQCQEKLYNEIVEVMGTNKMRVSNEDLREMKYLDMVYKEVLRLFPIGALIQRTVMEDIEISSGILPAGCSLVVPIYHLLRDARYWEQPDDFDPERFNPENAKKRQPYCYIPFSLGPMDCLGRYFGTTLIKTLCVQLLREYKLSSKENYRDLRIVIAVSVAPVDDYKLILTPRNIKSRSLELKSSILAPDGSGDVNNGCHQCGDNSWDRRHNLICGQGANCLV